HTRDPVAASGENESARSNRLGCLFGQFQAFELGEILAPSPGLESLHCEDWSGECAIPAESERRVRQCHKGTDYTRDLSHPRRCRRSLCSAAVLVASRSSRGRPSLPPVFYARLSSSLRPCQQTARTRARPALIVA